MAKGKITSDDFLKLLDDEESSSQSPAYSPIGLENKKDIAIQPPNQLMQPQRSDLHQEKLPTKYQQTGNKVPTDESAQIPKVPTKVPTEVPTKYQQTGNKVPTKSGFLALSGLQQNLVVFLYQLCRMRGERELENLRVDYLAISLETTAGAVKETVRRLEKKGVIKRTGYRNGRGGSSNYSLFEETYKEMFQLESTNKLVTKYQQSTNKLVSEVPTKVPTSPSSSSSDLYINRTTTTTEASKDFELSVARVVDFGITASAIARCFELHPTLEREKMQDLINRFAQFMTTADGKRIQNARGFFISLAEQLSKGITPLDHIETPETRLMRELVEKKKAQRTEFERLEKEMQDFDFEEWWEGLSASDRDLLVKPNGVLQSGSQAQKIIARQVHAEKFWTERKQKALESVNMESKQTL